MARWRKPEYCNCSDSNYDPDCDHNNPKYRIDDSEDDVDKNFTVSGGVSGSGVALTPFDLPPNTPSPGNRRPKRKPEEFYNS